MKLPDENLHQLTDHLFRHQSGKMVAVLTRIFGLSNMDIAEDVVQDTFARALIDWTYKMPSNPSAWLMLTAKNKTIDVIRRERHHKKFAEETSLLLHSEYSTAPVVENLFLPNEIRDSQLRMIFACCHPALSNEDQIALTLKTCSGFSIEEIASALLSKPEAIKKRVQRAKAFISANNLKFDIPDGKELSKRLDIVLQSIYLLFNEGYNSRDKSDLIRKDLCEEALRLAIMLTENEYTNKPKCFALVSLMTLLVSRFNSRLDNNGEIILLEDQNRKLWNYDLINLGLDYLNRASQGDELTEYHLEAAIVAEHYMAKAFELTNWNRILEFYELLANVNPSPVVLLNKAIVTGKIAGAEKAIELIFNIDGIEKLVLTNYLFTAVLGEMHKQLGNTEQAKTLFEKSILLTNSEAEKKLLRKKFA